MISIRRLVAAKFFVACTRSFSSVRLAQLLQCGSVDCHSLYWLDAVRKAAWLPTKASAPWPLEFVCQNYSMKHIFPPRLLTPADLGRDLAQWEFKTRWRLYLEDQDEVDEDSDGQNKHLLRRSLLSKRRTRFCPHTFSTETELFIQDSISKMYACGLKAVSLGRRNRLLYGTPKFLQLVHHTLRYFGLHALPTDKDGGMCLVEKEHLEIAVNDVVSNTSWYNEVLNIDNDIYTTALEEYHMAACAVADGDAALKHTLLSDMSFGVSNVCASLQHTVKTHKPAGSVVLRPIHAFGSNPMCPGMRWLKGNLRPVLERLPHLLKNSQDLMDKLRSFRLPRDVRFLKLDVKDFFLTGSHGFLIETCAGLLPPSERASFRLMADAVIRNQFITSGNCPGKTFRVVNGTGMGMIPSGDISDLVLFSCLEKNFILKPSNRREFGILFYCRFRDDILLIVNSSISSIRDLISNMNIHAAPFQLKLESMSSHKCQMLDLEITLCVRPSESFSLCSFGLYTKPTSIWQPLAIDSVHPKSIHKHWPIAQCQRIYSKFSCPIKGKRAVDKFKAQYAESFGINIAEKPGNGSRPIVSPTRWLVLKYHSSLVRVGFTSVVCSLVVPSWFPFKQIRTSWQLPNKHLIHLLRQKGKQATAEEKRVEAGRAVVAVT